MPYEFIPLVGLSFAATDRGSSYMGKLNAIAAAIDVAINGFNSQLQGAMDAESFALVAEEAAATLVDKASQAANSAVLASDWAEKAVDSPIVAGKFSAKHHATKAALSAQSASDDKVIATAKANEANTSALKAAKWAEGSENVEVDVGQFSAKHHAIKAAASAQSASSDQAIATTKAQEASGHATKAGQWAEADENAPVEPGKFSAKHHAAKAEYWASQAAGVTAGAMQFMGGYNASSNTWPAGAQAGFTYRINSAGTLGPFDDTVTRPVKPGDMIIKRADGNWSFLDAQDVEVMASATDTTPDRLMKVGAFGLGATAITITNWNSATINGATYKASGAANSPIPGWLIGTFLKHDAAYGIQFISAYSATASRHFCRNLYNGVWSDWVETLTAAGSYSNPAWLTELAGSKVTGDIPGRSSSLAPVITTLNTATTDQGKWTKVARFTLLAVFQDASVALAFRSYANGGSGDHFDTVLLRCKQNAALGNNPSVSLVPLVHNDVSAEYGYVIVQNSPSTIVELYVKNNPLWNKINGFQLSASSELGIVEYFSGQPYITSVAGLVVAENQLLITSKRRLSLAPLATSAEAESGSLTAERWWTPQTVRLAAIAAAKYTPLSVATTVSVGGKYYITASVPITLPDMTGQPVGGIITFRKSRTATPTLQRQGTAQIDINGVLDTSFTFDHNGTLELLWNGSTWEA